MQRSLRTFFITLVWILSFAFTLLGLALVDRRCKEAIYGEAAPVAAIEPIDHFSSQVQVGEVTFKIGVPERLPFNGVLLPSYFTAVINALGIVFQYWQ